ncbi:MAG: beta-glucanase (GH16 family) [Candidatus Latescibacterota bacterium]|jgi:beta-glucanase (GH16 family)
MFRCILLLSFSFITMLVSAQTPIYDYLVWADEFDGNGAIDPSNWHHQTQIPNGGSWYNNEIQHYTNRVANSYVSNGSLKVLAKKEVFTDQGVTKAYTSARLNSKFAFTYGKIEVRAKLPTGVGTWPAIWTLGKNIIEPGGYWSGTDGTVGWPVCGELDIMEHWGANQDYVSSAIHSPSSYGNTMNTGGRVVSGASTNYHLYTMEWFPEKIMFSIDGVQHYNYEPAVQNAETWPFDADQYVLLNVAVLPNIDPAYLESSMEIDYVRVYQETPLGINDLEEKAAITVYPNPVKNKLNIGLSADHIGGTLRIYSLLGILIEDHLILDTEPQLDFSLYQDGMYFLKVQSNSGVVSKNIIKTSL